jgi:hypothetical protein
VYAVKEFIGSDCAQGGLEKGAFLSVLIFFKPFRAVLFGFGGIDSPSCIFGTISPLKDK